jgi:hypothetical protein
MAAVASHLADTSALARLHRPAVAAVLGPLIEAGLVATCGVIEFELGWATRNGAEFRPGPSRSGRTLRRVPTVASARHDETHGLETAEADIQDVHGPVPTTWRLGDRGWQTIAR